MLIYVRNGGTWKLKRKTITFGSVGKNTVVGTVPNVGNISHAYGMVLLGSGSTVPLAFFHPDYPNRAASFSLTLPWLKPRDSCELGLLGFRRYA